MKTTIKNELLEYIEDSKNDYEEVTHFNLFNEDYYIIGYYDCEQWLKKHDLSVFEAMSIVQDYEQDNFGECQKYDNAEKLVNMLVYIYGEELCIEENIKFD